MDENKLKKLHQVGYDVQPCCALCKHSEFGHNAFGTCKKHQYDHVKHTGPDRQLSINKYGCCGFFETDNEKATLILQSFKQFF